MILTDSHSIFMFNKKYFISKPVQIMLMIIWNYQHSCVNFCQLCQIIIKNIIWTANLLKILIDWLSVGIIITQHHQHGIHNPDHDYKWFPWAVIYIYGELLWPNTGWGLKWCRCAYTIFTWAGFIFVELCRLWYDTGMTHSVHEWVFEY